MADRFMKQQLERKRRNKTATGNADARNNVNTRKSSKSELIDHFVHKFTNQSSADTDDSESLVNVNNAASSQSRPKRRRRTRSTRNARKAGKENSQSSVLGVAGKEKDENGSRAREGVVRKEAVESRVTMATGHQDYIKTIKAVTEMKAAAPLKTFGPTSSRLSVKFRGMFRDSRSSSVVRRRDPLKSTESSESDLLPDFQPSRRQSDVLSVLLKSGDRSSSIQESETAAYGERSLSVDRLRSRYRTPSTVDASPWRTPQSTTGAKYNSHSLPPDMGTVQSDMKASLKDVPSLVSPGYYEETVSRVRSLAIASHKDRTPEPKRRGVMSGDVATRRRLEELFTDDVPNSVNRGSRAEKKVPLVAGPAEDDLFVVKPVLDEVAECCDNPFVSRPSTSPGERGMEWLLDVDTNPFASQESYPIAVRESQEELVSYRPAAAVGEGGNADFAGHRGQSYRPAYDAYHEQLKNEGGLDFLDHISYEPCQCYKCLAVSGSSYGQPSYPPQLPVDHCSRQLLSQHSNGPLPCHSACDPLLRGDRMRAAHHHREVPLRQPLRDISFSASENSNSVGYHSNVRYQQRPLANRQHFECRSGSEFRRPLPPVMHDSNREQGTTPVAPFRHSTDFTAPPPRSTLFRATEPASSAPQTTSHHRQRYITSRALPSDYQRCEHYDRAQYRIADCQPVEESKTVRPEFFSPIF